MKSLGRSFLLGLTIVLPVVISIQLVIWLLVTVESWLMPLWLLLLPESWYIPGLAGASFLALVTAIGISSRFGPLQSLWKIPGRLLEKTPLVSYIYNTIKDFLDLLGGKNFADQTVVWVTLPDRQTRLLGIVMKTGEDKQSKLSDIIKPNEVAVYLPMSYQAGGYMLIVAKNRIEKVDISPGDAIRLIMSAGLGSKGTEVKVPGDIS